MTYWLNAPQPGELPMIDQRLTTGEPGFFDGLSASFVKAQIENNNWFRFQNEENRVVRERALSAVTRVPGLEADLMEKFGNRGGLTAQEAIEVNPNAARYAVEQARLAAEADPEAWRDIDLSEENIRAERNAALKADYDDAAFIQEMSPGLANFLGTMAGYTADPVNIPFLVAGGGSGSFLRVMGREAFINMSAEAAFLPGQYAAAEEIGIPNPDPVTQLAFAAGAGAVLGGMLEAGRRGLSYWQLRSSVRPIPGYTAADTARAVDLTEDAILAGEDPILALKTIPPTEPVPPPGMPPLILTGDQRTDVPRAPQAPVEADVARPAPVEPAAAEAAPAPVPAAPAARPTDEELDASIAEQKAIIDRYTQGNPLLQRLARGHLRPDPDNPRKLIPVGESYQIDPRGALGQILRSQDVRSGRKGVPVGLFSNEGRQNFDNLVRSEWEEAFPGITEATRTERTAEYLDQEGFADVLIRAARGDYDWLGEVAQAKKFIDDAERIKRGDPQEDLLSGRALEDDRGLFINRDLYEFDADEFTARARIADTVERYIDEHDPGLTRAERDEVIAVMQKYGGEVEYALERAHERRAAAIEAGPDEQVTWIPGFDEPPAAGRTPDDAQAADGQGSVGRSESEAPDGGGNAQAGRGPQAKASQLTIPDTDRVQTGQAQADRATLAARQQQSRMGRLDQTRVEDDAGGLFGGAQRELFSEPASPAVRPVLDNMAADLRDIIERDGDFMVDMGDGKGERSASSVLDDLDTGDQFADEIALCGRPKTNEAPF